MSNIKIESADQFLTSAEVADLLQMNPGSINNWVRAGRLIAFRTPGGHRRIKVAHILDFLETHQMPIPRALDAFAKRRLLLVDDDAAQLDALKRLLKPHQKQLIVEATTSGIDALVKVGSYKPHLIVLDVFMPGVDGIEVCRRLKANPETKDLGIVIASARMSKEIEEIASSIGIHHCMSKPIQIAKLIEIIGANNNALTGTGG